MLIHIAGEPIAQVEADADQQERKWLGLAHRLMVGQAWLTYLSIPYAVWCLSESKFAGLAVGSMLAYSLRKMYLMIMNMVASPRENTPQAVQNQDILFWELLLIKARLRLARAKNAVSYWAGKGVRFLMIALLAVAVAKPIELLVFGHTLQPQVDAWRMKHHHDLNTGQGRSTAWLIEQHSHIDDASLFIDRVRWMHKRTPVCLIVTTIVLLLFVAPLIIKSRLLARKGGYGARRGERNELLRHQIVVDVQQLNLLRISPYPEALKTYKEETEPQPKVKTSLPLADLSALLCLFRHKQD